MENYICNCGFTFSEEFSFCPKCGTKIPDVKVYPDLSPSPEPVKIGKFKKVGSSSLPFIAKQGASSSIIDSDNYNEDKTNSNKLLSTQSYSDNEFEELFEDEPDEEELLDNEEYEDEEDNETFEEDYDEKDFSDENDEMDEDTDEDLVLSEIDSNAKNHFNLNNTFSKHKSKDSKLNNNLKANHSSTIKHNINELNSYNPNHDGFYDDRLPAILDENIKYSHLEVILKISLSLIGIFSFIAYCIFYVKF